MDQLTKDINEVAKRIDSLIQESRREGRGRAQSAAAIQIMRQNVEVDSHWPIAWPYWPTGFRARVIAMSQKIIRRLLRWYLNPVVSQQNDFNRATLNAIQMLSNEIRLVQIEYAKSQATMLDQIEDLVTQVNALHNILREQGYVKPK